MEQLIKEIEAYADRANLKPATVLQYAGGYGSGVWAEWKAGRKTCTLRMAERLRKYMVENPPSKAAEVSCQSVTMRHADNNCNGDAA